MSFTRMCTPVCALIVLSSASSLSFRFPRFPRLSLLQLAFFSVFVNADVSLRFLALILKVGLSAKLLLS